VDLEAFRVVRGLMGVGILVSAYVLYRGLGAGATRGQARAWRLFATAFALFVVGAALVVARQAFGWPRWLFNVLFGVVVLGVVLAYLAFFMIGYTQADALLRETEPKKRRKRLP